MQLLRAKRGQAQSWVEENIGFKGKECLIWPFKSRSPNGYPIVWQPGKDRKTGASARFVSTIMCEMVNGPRPSSNFHAAHSCGNGHLGCVNPSHIRWKTVSENALERNFICVDKMPLKKREDIVRDFMSGLPPREISQKHGITLSYAYRVKEKKMMKGIWKRMEGMDCSLSA